MKQAYEVVGEFKEGLARIKKFGGYGFINEAGEQVIACNFSDASDFCEGLARVKKFGKFGFIDKNGEQVIECKFDDASDFCNGLARVKVNGKSFEIDTSGKDPNVKENDEKVEILKDISNFQSDVVELKKDEEFKPINVKDEDIRKIEIPIEFDDAKRIDRSSVVKNIVQEYGKWYEVDADGKMRPLDENSNEMDFLTKFTESDEFKKILSDSTKVFEWSNVSVNGKDIVLDKDGKKINLSKEGKKVVPLKDGNFMVEDSNGGKVEISKNGSAIVKESYKNQNLAHPSGNVTLKKGYIKPKKVRDWFIEKKKESDESFTITGTLGIVYNILKFIIRLFKR